MEIEVDGIPGELDLGDIALKLSDTVASAGAAIMSRTAAIVPPEKLAIAAIASALPAFPLRAIG